MAVEATPPDHPDRAAQLGDFSDILSRRFEQTGRMDDLNRAIEVGSMAVEATPDHPDRAGWLYRLGNSLSMRFEQTD